MARAELVAALRLLLQKHEREMDARAALATAREVHGMGSEREAIAISALQHAGTMLDAALAEVVELLAHPAVPPSSPALPVRDEDEPNAHLAQTEAMVYHRPRQHEGLLTLRESGTQGG